jgi:hypothetical protein
MPVTKLTSPQKLASLTLWVWADDQFQCRNLPSGLSRQAQDIFFFVASETQSRHFFFNFLLSDPLPLKHLNFLFFCAKGVSFKQFCHHLFSLAAEDCHCKTELHTIAGVYCFICQNLVGWKYESLACLMASSLKQTTGWIVLFFKTFIY